jgi:hypothetical protein
LVEEAASDKQDEPQHRAYARRVVLDNLTNTPDDLDGGGTAPLSFTAQ